MSGLTLLAADSSAWSDGRVEAIAQMVGGLLGLLGLGIGLLQYADAQKWKRSEFAAAQLELLTKDPELELCCKLLDWAGRVSPVPEKYSALTSDKQFVHDWETMKTAMLPEEATLDVEWTWQHMMYRDLFDRFFGYLDRINHYISIGLISTRDVASLDYWLEQIIAPRFAPARDRQLFVAFLERYGYDGTLELSRRLVKSRPK
ncbi:MAG: hypothetical protein ABW321_26370 [Polyangiales bacterium]